LILWRISNHEDLSGFGGLKVAGRWHSAGRPVVYLAEHPALALLETLVHLEIRTLEDLPDNYKLLRVEAPDGIALTPAQPSAGWQSSPAITRRLGDDWLAARQTALLRVPSVLVPGHNTLLNPLHPDAHQIAIAETLNWPFDARLAGSAVREPVLTSSGRTSIDDVETR
jgi:RES domain-containing protein